MKFTMGNKLVMMLLLRNIASLVASSSSLISDTKAQLPFSMSMIISDLEAEGVAKVTTACLITSRSVTTSERASLVQSLFGLDDDAEQISCLTSFGKKLFDDDNDGIAICNPGSEAAANEVASTAEACGGTIVFAPSPSDLSRGEGLFDSLAPAMERIMKTNDATDRKAVLVVVATGDLAMAKKQFEQAASVVLDNLVQPSGSFKKSLGLEDVFDAVEYISADTHHETFEDMICHLGGACDLDGARNSVKMAVAQEFSLSTSVLSMSTTTISSKKDLAIARLLGPAARNTLASTIQRVREIASNEAGVPTLVANFGDLCDAAVNRALEDLDAKVPSTSGIAKQMKANLKEDMYSELGDVFDDQLKLCQLASFEAFNGMLSQLRVSPALDADMAKVVSESLAEFEKASKKLKAKGATSWSTAAAKTEQGKSLNEFCTDRLLVARASGQYKPVPRKGLTVGLHWLLPKPFGNDFRQEPWMVHASDNMVFVPKDKITDVSPEEIKEGDWRSKIVPSPTGNDIVYMQ